MLKIEGVNVTLRPFRESDRAYVESTWRRQAILQARRDEDLFARWFRPLVRRRVSHDPVVIACLDDMPDIIVGWGAADGAEHEFGFVANNTKNGFNARGHGLYSAIKRELEKGFPR